MHGKYLKLLIFNETPWTNINEALFLSTKKQEAKTPKACLNPN